ncbi:MAG: tRNA uridine-5-carboxymethylaminomethyl(34) synthesis enzyme MnmG [Bacilli bacterium]|nr:tRNA uridine-5-carboxymethylaminomethyl(34) synthesis enzyme MnmG [Bacilli bacterium]MDD4282374.1 tRNA uridine-5-carboxymethylaminomethyl(34) synthesis enzyme MnmG [Bacilli bacterium]MDD4718251.1 tRNA uridine-5-carboxymethylaminomethyl(34) synthesis enzyme MnmG [Bacilli bacterium]
MKYEIIVVGGGHAGCEAALASSRKNHKTLLITSNINNIADMACNPSIGGSAKGVVVREIDALGGEMGKVSDRSQIQIKKLNSRKGPAVQALRAQIDKIVYPKIMIETLKNQINLEILEGMVEDLIIENNIVKGVILQDKRVIKSDCVILTTGTYLKSDVLIGSTRTRKGPHDEKPSLYLSDNLKKIGFKIIRLKTGTPPRIDKKTIDFTKTRIEKGDDIHLNFNHDYYYDYDSKNQEPCYLTYTNSKLHEIIHENLNKSSMYGGLKDITSVGPRYCPSIEDKVVRFSDKDRHQIFLEPESRYYDDIYIQGLSTSMPHDIQTRLVHSIEGLENAKILKYAYAIEYDAINPTQIKQNLETKLIENLYTAGQINGTSGYEEAACQGLLAGINASLKLEGKEPLILKRNEAYIGVLIDDLIIKGVTDPYRLLTSRAEYRLLLRHDNADIRLRQKGYEVGLISEEIYSKFQDKLKKIKQLLEILKNTKLTPTEEINEYLVSINSAILKDGITMYDLLKRPEIKISNFKKFIELPFEPEIIEQVEINIKYEGYINKANKDVEKMLKLEEKKIPDTIDYDKIHNLANEATQKLKEVRPTSIGQALRISGVNPADISILMIYLKKGDKNE